MLTDHELERLRPLAAFWHENYLQAAYSLIIGRRVTQDEARDAYRRLQAEHD
tara:strand:- start:440 stop:595 length:156 start_codon:yes stop_codon:yes gene_type:complete